MTLCSCCFAAHPVRLAGVLIFFVSMTAWIGVLTVTTMMAGIGRHLIDVYSVGVRNKCVEAEKERGI